MYGLYRTSKSNFSRYYADGAGRDGYIVFDNAGIFQGAPLSPIGSAYKTGTQFFTSIKKHNKSNSVKTPNFHYHADGYGRDRYIAINGGGLFSDSKSLLSYQLSDFLRKNDCLYEYKKKSHKNMNISLSKSEIAYKRYLKKKEKDLINRLYNIEKRKFVKKKENILNDSDEKYKSDYQPLLSVKINNKLNKKIKPKIDVNMSDDFVKADVLNNKGKLKVFFSPLKKRKFVTRVLSDENILFPKGKNVENTKTSRKLNKKCGIFKYDMDKFRNYQIQQNNKRFIKIKDIDPFENTENKPQLKK